MIFAQAVGIWVFDSTLGGHTQSQLTDYAVGSGLPEGKQYLDCIAGVEAKYRDRSPG